MTTGRVLISAAALAVIAAAALLLTLFPACSDGTTRPASSAPAVPTPVGKGPAETIEDALMLAREIFTAAPPYVVHDIQSVVYVETTVGQARDLFDPSRTTPTDRWFAHAPADSPVWVVVANGRFQMKSVPGSTTPGPSYSAVWVVIPKGQLGMSDGAGNQQFDLTELGTVVQVPVPLPPFPTPVTLDSQ